MISQEDKITALIKLVEGNDINHISNILHMSKDRINSLWQNIAENYFPTSDSKIEPIVSDFIFYKDINSVYQYVNNGTAKLLGYNNGKEFRGKNDFEFKWTKAEAEIYRSSDLQVMEAKEAFYFKLPHSGSKGSVLFASGYKIPIFNDRTGKPQGILGCFTTENQKYLGIENLLQLTVKELINIAFIKSKYKMITFAGAYYVTKKELVCALFIIRGYSARQIGIILNLSGKTVETHIAYLKEKLECCSKSDLIGILIQSKILWD